MDGTTKTDISENVPISKVSVNFDAIISDMKIFETESNRKISKLEARLQEADSTIIDLQKENEYLKTSLAAKERDCKLYYRQYQNIAQEFEDFKNNPCKKPNDSVNDKVEPDVTESPEITESPEPAIVVDDSSDDENPDDENPNVAGQPTWSSKNLNFANKNQLENSTPMSAEESTSKQHSPKKDLPEASRKRLGPEITSGQSTKKSKCDQILLPTPSFFKCRFICPKPNENTFGSIDEYRQHIIDDHPERRFICGRCPFSTNKKCNLDKHFKRFHDNPKASEDRYGCKLCGIGFPKKGTLTVHIKSYH